MNLVTAVKFEGEDKEVNTLMVWHHGIIGARTQTLSETLMITWDGEPWPPTLSGMAHDNDDDLQMNKARTQQNVLESQISKSIANMEQTRN